MRKKIPVTHVRIGMRVVELDVSWLQSPFWRREFTINTQKELQQLQECCKSVVIDVMASTPASLAHFRRRPAAEVKVVEETEEIEQAPEPKEEIPIEKRTGLLAAPELLSRKELQHIESNIAVCVDEIKDVFTRIGEGKLVSCKKLTDAVKRLADDALNDAASLLLLSRLKEKEQSLAEKSVNVCILTIAFAQYLQLDSHKIHVLGLGALLHDVGMLKVPEYLLTHQGPMNKAQKQAIEYHVIEGMSFVGLHDELSSIRELRDIIGSHHERYDGSGYPKGLKGDKIPYLARILGITSTYEAMTRERFYSAAASPTQVLSKMYSWRSKLFDASLVQQFIKALGVYPPGSMVALEDNQVALVTAINPENRARPVIRLLTNELAINDSYSEELNLMLPELAHIKIARTLDESDFTRLAALGS
ncbi:HD-GYP domain, c-di-GMP phosphodiesterase class II (or its inactivated variant) [Oceanospirillum multiglobuliferum]|uniref:HD-GYP domain-containing protein n=1 Tax=Oceanospirillum multiglobuliferum TaxID=64969 RepID=A0A1T4L7B5_9GAMM|nr:HD-GYP domain-containing protein [Oceanospirillum multiglobuliferum]OPX56768.1 hypothetical protein BTE48_02500 [Oceanospirillum multiglobuliferum]SJZ50599.1 HD-GYP domain, c-di-GMP phosphodiesterase class II (or its inactivated variant) [Oceanospirillum multiglobuliferum]